MKKIKIITDSETFTNFVNDPAIEVISVDVRGCEQSYFAQESFIAVIFYKELQKGE